MSEPELFRIGEAAQFLAISRSKAYALVKAGALPTIMVGKTLRIPRQGLLEWIASRTAKASD